MTSNQGRGKTLRILQQDDNERPTTSHANDRLRHSHSSKPRLPESPAKAPPRRLAGHDCIARPSRIPATMAHPLFSALLIFSAFVSVAFLAALAARHIVRRAYRGAAAAVLVAATMHAPLLPRLLLPNSMPLPEYSMYLYWILVCCTWVFPLRIGYFLLVRSAAYARSLPLSFVVSSMMFNTDVEKGPAGVRRWRDPGQWSRVASTLLLGMPAKFALLAWLALMQAPAERVRRVYEAVYTARMFTPQFLYDSVFVSLIPYPFLSLPFDLYLVIGTLLTGWPMQPMFASPALTTSPRDFWSGRWNLLVKNTFHRTLFAPATGSHHGNHKKHDDAAARVAGKEAQNGAAAVPESKAKGKEAPRPISLAKMASSLMVFAVSALGHDWMNWLCFGRYTPDNAAFFMLHGLMANLEVIAMRTSWGRRLARALPRPAKIACMWVLMAMTVPIFMREYVRAGMIAEIAGYAGWVVDRLGIRVV
ncbi:hypothetical protein DFJ74DRAFT_262310 [Hyaloraphidium curvatum]|nr:hypothetical protein DFJ74DRAFT_262310 [Hyaloraphidium curvatum]